MSCEKPADPAPTSIPNRPTATVHNLTEEHRSAEKLPESIGRYSIKRIIAFGGMGVVYEARQENPRRAVAVKVMSHGVTSKSAMRRFEFEAQVLGRLRHPGIAQIYEAGTHDDQGLAVPYFAMEYIPGAQSVTQFVKDKKLGTRERMTLFTQVCDAVHHGHQKGVIHRDLKPSNILVDASGQVKVIDFGVARGTDSDLALTTLQTDMGQLIGTLQYMSPEQCAGDPHDIDIRSDVYSLGVVFFELLSGRLPYDVREKALSEATRVIREEPPTRLSLIDRTLRGDVETIALKALEKDRSRRYQSASDFGKDIEHYLVNEPISARPPSMLYRLRKFVRRRRVPLAVTAATAVAITVGVIQQVRLRWSESLIRNLETMNRVSLAVQPDADFINPAKVIQACTEAIEVDPSFALGYALRAKAFTRKDDLDSAWRDASKALELAPDNTYALRALGHVFVMRGDFAKAKESYERGFRHFADKNNPDLPRDLHNQARALSRTGHYQLALAAHDGAVALAPRTSRVYLSRAITRRCNNDIDGALADIDHGLELDPSWGVQASLWEWEMRMLRQRDGDGEAAARALAVAEKAAKTEFERSVARVLQGGLAEETLKSQAKTDKERCCANYYLGVKALIDGNKPDARSKLTASVQFNLHELPEHDLGLWHLGSLQSP